MQSTNKPALYLTPFAQNDPSRAEIPNTTADATRASQTLGFPPLTGLPPEAGGVPPQLPDMNGALNQPARIAWWGQLGGRFTFDPVFAASPAIDGYPRGATLQAVSLAGEWISTAEANQADPDTAGTGWVPGYHYGATTLTGQSGGTVALTPAQAARKVLIISGTLTSNLTIEVPAWVYDWTIYNNTAGAFSVNVRTPGQPSITIPNTNAPTTIRCDGVTVATTSVEVPSASTTVAGIVRLATTAEATAGTLTTIAVTPAGLSAAVASQVPAATTVVVGRTRFATNAEAIAGTLATVAVTPAALAASSAALVPAASTTVAGRTRYATGAEAAGGTVTDAAVTPAALAAGVATLVPAASTTVAGRTRFATNAEAIAGTLATVATTPASATALVDSRAVRLTTDQTIAGVKTFSSPIVSSGLTSTTSTIVVGPGNAGNVALRPNGVNSTAGQLIVTSTGNVTTPGAIYAGGGFDSGSSREVKEGIEPLRYGLDQVLALDTVHFRYRADFIAGGRQRNGWIAEEVQAVIPEAVGPGDAVCPLYLQTDQLVPVLWAAVQELAAEVRELRAAAGL